MTTPDLTAPDRRRLVIAWSRERNAAADAIRRNDPGQAWAHLERAHIVSQPLAGRHVRTHIAMLRFALRHHEWHEVAGQMLRTLLAAPGSWSGRYPVGNTGGSNVNAFTAMDIPNDLRPLLTTSVTTS